MTRSHVISPYFESAGWQFWLPRNKKKERDLFNKGTLAIVWPLNWSRLPQGGCSSGSWDPQRVTRSKGCSDASTGLGFHTAISLFHSSEATGTSWQDIFEENYFGLNWRKLGIKLQDHCGFRLCWSTAPWTLKNRLRDARLPWGLPRFPCSEKWSL